MTGRNGALLACFYADWCPHCIRYLPHFERHSGRPGIELAEVDVSDEDDPLWEELSLAVVPTLILFRDGFQVARVDGVLGRGLRPDDIDRLISAS